MVSSTSRCKRILIAEDDPSIRHLLSTQLKMETYEVIQAEDGEEAWQLLQAEDLPDLILLDVLMPKMDGFEVCRRIRATPRLAALPVVILTALRDSASRLEGLEAGANDFLGKPWSKVELQTRIRTLLRLKETQDSLHQQHTRLRLLYDVSRALAAQLDLDQRLSALLTNAGHALEAQGGSIILLSDGKAWRKIQTGRENTPEIVNPPTLNPIEAGLVSWLFKARKALLIADTALAEQSFNWGPVRSVVAAPLMLDAGLRGSLLFVHSQPNWFENEHLELLGSISRQATLSIEYAWLYRRAREERQRFAALLTSMDDAVIATDRNQNIILVNPAGADLLGRGQDELEGKSITSEIKSSDLLSLFDQVAEKKEPHALQVDWNENKTLYVTISPVGDMGQVAVIQDITALKAYQAMQLAAEKEKTAQVRATFERYMSPALVDRALSEQGLIEERRRCKVALLFADLRGFTRLTVRFSPDDVVTILNDFFTVMTGVAYLYHGTIFDIAGDELMVGFGAPFDMPDPAMAAVKCAIEMQNVFGSLSEKWWQTYGDQRVGLGIGIDYGEVVIGNVGSPTRMNYALVGLTVNRAHGLVAMATDGEIRFSESVRKGFQTDDLSQPATPLTDVQLKGHDEPVTIYCIKVERASVTS
jgi:PAS domain S-box-containing protein